MEYLAIFVQIKVMYYQKMKVKTIFGLRQARFCSFTTGTIACDDYARECKFGILKNKKTTTKKNKKNLLAVF